MKKVIKITLTFASAAIAVIGAGTIAGTYGSYKNYQAISDMQNIINSDQQLPALISSTASTFGFSINDISPDGWNDHFATWSDLYKESQNEYIYWFKNQTYMSYPTYFYYQEFAMQNGLSLQLAEETWNLYSDLFSLNFDYNAEQGGVIAGSVLLSIGFVAFIGFLVIFLKKKKIT